MAVEYITALLKTDDGIFRNDVNFAAMVPDYPHKRFADQRSRYSLLMEVLAID